jgi:hypothetical protein
MEQAGADALEQNIYQVATDIEVSSSEIEQRYIELLSQLKQHGLHPHQHETLPRLQLGGKRVEMSDKKRRTTHYRLCTGWRQSVGAEEAAAYLHRQLGVCP